MNVNPNRDLPSAATTARQSKQIAPAAATVETDFAASTKLAGKLTLTPEVRAAAVARAKALVADPNYPGPAVVEKIAGHLADHLAAPGVKPPTPSV